MPTDIRAGAFEGRLEDVIHEFASGRASESVVARLAEALAASGRALSLSRSRPVLDVASTGGPGSLSTLVCPLLLRGAGGYVAKLGVSGRPAGGIDVMAQIPGFRIHLTKLQALRVLARSGFVHCLAGSEFAPLDAQLFRLRQELGYQAVPTLVIASILAKKLVMGVNLCGIDVRIAPFNNFGRTLTEARDSGQLMTRIAASLGIGVALYLTRSKEPLQPFIGRGEALLALRNLVQEHQDKDLFLQSHYETCVFMASHLASRVKLQLGRQSMKEILELHISSQDGSVDGFYDYAERIEHALSHELIAKDYGYFSIDLVALRTAIVRRQQLKKTAQEPFPDPCGLRLISRPGEFVSRGDLLALIRCDEGGGRAVKRDVSRAVSLLKTPPAAVSESTMEILDG